jgi:hypothetical protein
VRPNENRLSIDDALLQQTDAAARAMGLSRSRLIALALAEYLERRQRSEMLLQLNEAYGESTGAGDKRLLNGMKRKFQRAGRDRC